MSQKFKFFDKLMRQSQAEKRGLTIFIKGQPVVGIVTEIIGTEAVELRSQLFSRTVVSIDSIDAMAIS